MWLLKLKGLSGFLGQIELNPPVNSATILTSTALILLLINSQKKRLIIWFANFLECHFINE